MKDEPQDDEPCPASFQQDQVTQRLGSIRARLVETNDSHLQAKLLLEYSSCAISPSAKTEAAIDFLFSFLQQNQSTSTTSTNGKEEGQHGSSAVVVGAIVRGLRGLLAVKASVVEPMIQIDAMGEQLTQCISVPEDFKLRHDMLHIVVDCLLLANKDKEAERLVSQCLADHDRGLRVICLKSCLRLIDTGHTLENIDIYCKASSEMLVFERDVHIRVLCARVLGALATVYGDKGVHDSDRSVVKLGDHIAFVLASVVRDDCVLVRREIALSFRLLGPILSRDTLNHLLQKKTISETLENVEKSTCEMMSSGALLTLLEDHDAEVAMEASKSIRTLGDHPHQWNEALFDRVIAAHIEMISTTSCRVGFLTALDTLDFLLQARKELLSLDYPIDGEEISYLLGSCSHLGLELDILNAVLAALASCDLSTIHVITPLVQFLLHLPPIRVVTQNPSDENSERAILKLIFNIGVKDTVMIGRLPQSLKDELQSAAKSSSARILRDQCCDALIRGACGAEYEDKNAEYVSMTETIDRSVPPTDLRRALIHIRDQQRVCQASNSLPLDQVYLALLQLREFVEKASDKWATSPHPLVQACKDLFMGVSAISQRCSSTLSSRVHVELVQLDFMGRLGSYLTTSMERVSLLTLIPKTRTLLQHYSGHDAPGLMQWIHLLDQNKGEPDAKRVFIETVRLTWPSATFEHVEWVRRSLQYTRADVVYPIPWSEPHDVTSVLPFECRIRCLVHHVTNGASVFAKVRLPSQEIVRIKLHRVRTIHHSLFEAEATARLVFPPFSDPTVFSITICMSTVENDVEVSETIEYPIQYRTIASGRPQNRTV